MQKYYFHGVPSDETTTNDDSDRIALVFREGTYKIYKRDLGQPVDNLDPRKIPGLMYGQINDLTEGNSYTRAELRETGAHT